MYVGMCVCAEGERKDVHIIAKFAKSRIEDIHKLCVCVCMYVCMYVFVHIIAKFAKSRIEDIHKLCVCICM